MCLISMTPEQKIEQLGLVLPKPLQVPEGLILPFSWVRVRGNKAYISGHVPLNQDGTIYNVTGKLGGEVTLDQGYEAARQTALVVLSSLKRELGSLNRITAWLRVFGMVNTSPGFVNTAQVINGFSDLIIEIYGKKRGGHSRAAVGMAQLPINMPVEIEAEVEVSI